MKALLVVLLALIALAGCRASVIPGEPVAGGATWQGTEAINYVHDEVHGVGCWFYASSGASSISCLPDAEYLP